MEISAAELGRYRQALSGCRDDAAEYVRGRVLSECSGLGVADAREAAKGIVADAVEAFGARSQALACELFDEVAEAEGIMARATVCDGLTDPDDIDGKVRYYARRFESGDLEGFAADCARRAAFYTWREANLCVAQNAGG